MIRGFHDRNYYGNYNKIYGREDEEEICDYIPICGENIIIKYLYHTYKSSTLLKNMRISILK